MPRRYEAIRDKAKSQGMSDKAAKRKAARIYNATRKPGEAPVGPHSDEGKMAGALHERKKRK